MAKLEFKEKPASHAKGIYRIKIDEFFKSIEDKKNRNEWYRNFLGVNNAVTFANTVDETGKTNGEVLVVLDVKASRVTQNTLVSYAEFGLSGPFTNTYIEIDLYSLHQIKNFTRFLPTILEDMRATEDERYNAVKKTFVKKNGM